MSLPTRIQAQNVYLTYLDSEQKLVGPAWLLEQLVTRLSKFTPYYGICCRERAPTTGTVHYHILVCCRERCRTRNTELVEIEGIKPHWEKVNNNLKAIIEYIKKDGEVAEFNKDQIPVNDTKMTKAQKNMLLLKGDLYDEYVKGNLGPVEVLRAVKIRGVFNLKKKPAPYAKKLVLWFKGESGEGKTRMAVDIAEKYNLNYWMSAENLKWFDGFEDQEIAIIDEFRKSMLSDWSYFLRLLDGYSLTVQVKGAFTIWNPKIVIITSPASPAEAFQWVDRQGNEQQWDRIEQLERRLTWKEELQVYEFPLWDEEKARLFRTINDFLGIESENAMVEEELSLSPILPEPSQNDEA